MSQKIVIIGGGFGGLNVAKRLGNTAMDVVLLDKTNHHLFQPLLYQVASAALSPSNIALPLREILRKHDNIKVFMADVIRIHRHEQYVEAANGDRFSYDHLVIATGASHSYFGHPEWEEHAPGLKTIADAETIRERILLTFEEAERCFRFAEEQKFLRFIIIGAGPTGVEMAGAVAEICHKTLFRNFRRIKPEHSEIWLIEGTGQVLPTYPPSLGNRAKKDLEKMGVKIVLNQQVTNIVKGGVFLGEEYIEAHNIIWAAGNRTGHLLTTLETPLDRAGRVIVESTMTLPNDDRIFVIGDAATVTDKTGRPLPGIAPVAIQQGAYVAKALLHPQRKRKPFVYWDKGMLATIGRAKAVGVMKTFYLTGLFAWLTWGLVHIFYLISFKNRLLVMIQ